MNVKDIELGDVVRLNSGGPNMTVKRVGPRSGEGMGYPEYPREQAVYCEWFGPEQAVKTGAEFPAYMLVKS